MRTGSAGLWVRWSLRDLRRRWLLVAALALTIAVGTGAYAGLGGTNAWRIASNDASYALLRMHDLRVRLPDGGFVVGGDLAAAARSIDAAGSIEALEERLIVPIQLEASGPDGSVAVAGELVGMAAGSSGASVDRLYLAAGRGLRPDDAGQPTAVLESKFAATYDLPPLGTVALADGERVQYVGTGYTPEYFRVVGRSGQLLGETNFAVLFAPLASVQRITGRDGAVNDLVLRLRAGTDRDAVESQLADAVAGLGGTVTTRDDDPVFRGLYADAKNDQRVWNMFALLILLGAAFAAFNLMIRMIEAQRRELGVGMALGVLPRALARRPLLAGCEVAVAGVSAGVGVGWLLGAAMRREMAVLLPLPVWRTPFQTGRFLQGAALGLAIPIVATLFAIRRVLRLQPVDAIRTGAYGAAGRVTPFMAVVQRLRVPGRAYRSMPLRNALRAPRRSALTALGIAGAVACLVAVVGLLDSFVAMSRSNARELERSSPDRLTVTLAGFLPQTAPEVRTVSSTPGVGRVEMQLRLPVRLSAGGRSLDALVDLLDLDSQVWHPTVVAGDPAHAADGIVLSHKAAADLGLRPGDEVRVTHPVRTPTGLRLATSTLVVSGIHPNPLRPFTFVDIGDAARFGLAGFTNQLIVVPAAGTSQAALRRALYALPGVAIVEPTTGISALLTQRLDELTGILRVIELVTLLLALLVAFNSAGLSADERVRENATMFAFGLPRRTVLGMAMTENALLGVVGTAGGVGLGFAALRWIVEGFGSVLPDLFVEATLSGRTVVTILIVGTAVVAVAPVLTARRQGRMDIPAALRVIE